MLGANSPQTSAATLKLAETDIPSAATLADKNLLARFELAVARRRVAFAGSHDVIQLMATGNKERDEAIFKATYVELLLAGVKNPQTRLSNFTSFKPKDNVLDKATILEMVAKIPQPTLVGKINLQICFYSCAINEAGSFSIGIDKKRLKLEACENLKKSLSTHPLPAAIAALKKLYKGNTSHQFAKGSDAWDVIINTGSEMKEFLKTIGVTDAMLACPMGEEVKHEQNQIADSKNQKRQSVTTVGTAAAPVGTAAPAAFSANDVSATSMTGSELKNMQAMDTKTAASAPRQNAADLKDGMSDVAQRAFVDRLIGDTANHLDRGDIEQASSSWTKVLTATFPILHLLSLDDKIQFAQISTKLVVAPFASTAALAANGATAAVMLPAHYPNPAGLELQVDVARFDALAGIENIVMRQAIANVQVLDAKKQLTGRINLTSLQFQIINAAINKLGPDPSCGLVNMTLHNLKRRSKIPSSFPDQLLNADDKSPCSFSAWQGEHNRLIVLNKIKEPWLRHQAIQSQIGRPLSTDLKDQVTALNDALALPVAAEAKTVQFSTNLAPFQNLINANYVNWLADHKRVNAINAEVLIPLAFKKILAADPDAKPNLKVIGQLFVPPAPKAGWESVAANSEARKTAAIALPHNLHSEAAFLGALSRIEHIPIHLPRKETYLVTSASYVAKQLFADLGNDVFTARLENLQKEYQQWCKIITSTVIPTLNLSGSIRSTGDAKHLSTQDISSEQIHLLHKLTDDQQSRTAYLEEVLLHRSQIEALQNEISNGGALLAEQQAKVNKFKTSLAEGIAGLDKIQITLRLSIADASPAIDKAKVEIAKLQQLKKAGIQPALGESLNIVDSAFSVHAIRRAYADGLEISIDDVRDHFPDAKKAETNNSLYFQVENGHFEGVSAMQPKKMAVYTHQGSGLAAMFESGNRLRIDQVRDDTAAIQDAARLLAEKLIKASGSSGAYIHMPSIGTGRNGCLQKLLVEVAICLQAHNEVRKAEGKTLIGIGYAGPLDQYRALYDEVYTRSERWLGSTAVKTSFDDAVAARKKVGLEGNKPIDLAALEHGISVLNTATTQLISAPKIF